MFAEEARLASFSCAAASSSSSKKKQAKADTSAWPHPTTGRAAKTSGIPLPAVLAKCGFHHTPTDDASDTVTHFLYPEAVIWNWQSGDDPLIRLNEVVPDNGWCKIFWSLDNATQQDATWVWTRSDLLPTNKELIEARKSTFGTLWPYDGKKGWKPTSKKLAEAGFYFTPTDEEEDSATCIYCKKSLGGWEKGDDPTHEHQKRKPDCPFFNCTLAAEPEPVTETLESAVEDEVDEGIQMPKRGKRAVSSARKPSARAPKSKATAEPAPTEPEVENEVMPEPEEEPKPPPRSMRAASRRATKAIELINSDTDINRIPRKEEVQRAVQHAATDPVPFPSSETGYGPLSDPIGAAVSKPKRSRSKNKKLDETLRDPTPQPEAETTVIEHQEDEGNENVQEVEEVEEPKRRGRGRITKASTLDSASTAPPPPTRTRKVSRKVLATSEPEPEPAVVEDVEPIVEVPQAAEPPLPDSKSSRAVSGAAVKAKKSKTATKSTSRRTTTAATSEAEVEDAEDKGAEQQSDAVIGDTVTELATAASQATIRASDEDRAARPSVTRTSRAPLSQLSQLDTLQLDDKQRSMTLGLWLQLKADAAAQEMRQSGLTQLQDLENQMQTGRLAVERALRGEQS